MTEESNNKENEWKEREIGALWKKEGRNQNYFSGRLKLKNVSESEEINIVGFSNKKKAEFPNAPDVILYQSVPRESVAVVKEEALNLDLDEAPNEL